MSRRLRIALLAAVVLLATAGGALAFYSANGTGRASAGVGTLSAPVIANATPGAGTVSLSWSAVTPPGAGAVTYYVRRNGGAASAACPAIASPSGVTSCTDTGVPIGTHSYTVTAVWRSWTATSGGADATVASGAATQLVVTTQPSSATGGTAFPTQPVVTARDAGGNTVTAYTGTVTLSIKSGTGARDAALSGCSGTRVNGVTTFSGCKIDKAGTGYRLTATDGSLTVDTNTFNVTVGSVAQLAFTTQPAGTSTAGSDFRPQPVVTARDAGGNTVIGYAGTVTLAIKSGTGTAGAGLDGCSGSRRDGVVTFSGCDIDEAGAGYVLTASDGALRVDSAAFDITPGALSRFVFTTQPVGGVAGTVLPTQPVVKAVDAFGNTITDWAGTVTLSLLNAPGGSPVTGCVGTKVAGVTSFSGCTVTAADDDLRLRASSGGVDDDSAEFTVTPAALSALDLDTQDTTPTAGVAEDLTIRAVDQYGNTVTSYTGSKSLTFGGASLAPNGTAPTVGNSSSVAIPFGSATALTFSNGQASTRDSAASMTLYKAETARITVADGTLTNGAGLSVTTSAASGARVAWTSVAVSSGTLSSPCFFTCTVTGMANSATFRANVSVTDAYSNIASNVGSGHNVTLTRTAGSGTFAGGSSTASLTMPTTGTATTASQFTYTVPSFGSWSTNTITAASRDFTTATASLSR